MTTVPFARVTSIARLTTAWDLVAAVISVRSAPRPPVRSRTSALNDVRIARARRRCPSAARALDAGRVEIEADDVAAGGAQELRGDLADQAQAENRHTFAELRRGPAHTLQRDRTHRGGRREA